jgi:AmmeMemoRadiSam system protein A
MVHRNEHSLEVQMPFLKRLDPDLEIVPIMIAESSNETCKRLGIALASLLEKRTDVLLIASSDLYHGYSYKDCLDTDELTLSYIEELNPEGLVKALSSRRAQACGGHPIAVLLHTAINLGADRANLLKYTNSADVTDDRTGYVVGYSSWAILKSEHSPNSGSHSLLTEEERRELLAIAKKSVEAKLSGRAIPRSSPASPALREKCGAFVTLTKSRKLRGCIGYILPVKPLHETVSDAAIQAATSDPRFPPVGEEELSQIAFEISVLTPLVRVDDPTQVEVGKHGLYIKKGMNAGLLLPQVATDHGWDRETFLEQTCAKAGLPPDAWREDAEIYVFSAEVFAEATE